MAVPLGKASWKAVQNKGTLELAPREWFLLHKVSAQCLLATLESLTFLSIYLCPILVVLVIQVRKSCY